MQDGEAFKANLLIVFLISKINKNITNTSTENFRIIFELHFMGNSELAAHFKEFTSNATYLSPDIRNELTTLIDEEILSSISSAVKAAS